MSKSNITIIIVVVVILGLGYILVSGGSKSNTVSTGTMDIVDSGASSIDGARVLSLLNQIQSLDINTEIFDKQEYITLIDNTVKVPTQNVGRQNPFAPVPGMVRVQSGTAQAR